VVGDFGQPNLVSWVSCLRGEEKVFALAMCLRHAWVAMKGWGVQWDACRLDVYSTVASVHFRFTIYGVRFTNYELRFRYVVI
jgi:hypothetical protein